MALCRGMVSWMAAIGCPSVGQNLPSLSNALEGYPGSPFPARINQPRRWSDHTLDSREQISGLICLAFQLAVSGWASRVFAATYRSAFSLQTSERHPPNGEVKTERLKRKIREIHVK